MRYALLLVVLALTIAPFLWQLSTSLKSLDEDIYTATPSFLPEHPTLDNYAGVADTIPVWSYALNSLTVAAIVVAGNLIGATLAGFALARLQFRGAKLVFGLFLATLVLPGEVTIISQYVTVRGLGLADTLLGVALPGAIGDAQRAADVHRVPGDSQGGGRGRGHRRRDRVAAAALHRPAQRARACSASSRSSPSSAPGTTSCGR